MEHPTRPWIIYLCPRPPPSGGCSTAQFANIQFLATSAAAKSQEFFAR
ncbi:hypothetical protein THAOC_32482, partial [Thalassiosira oceanica]